MVFASFAPLLSLGIFVAEMCVVTVGTLRIIFIARGWRYLAPLLGFVEVVTWLFAISQVMQHLSSPECFLAFALGFTAGNFLGMHIERKLAMGKVIVRVITHRDAGDLLDELRAGNFGYTCVQGEGATGSVRIVMTVVQRRQLDNVLRLVKSSHPRAFYSVDELQDASDGIFPSGKPRRGGVLPSALRWFDPMEAWKAFEGRDTAAGGLMMSAAHEQSEIPGRSDGEADRAA